MERSQQGQAAAWSKATAAPGRTLSGVVYHALITLGAIALWIALFFAMAGLGGCSRPLRGPAGPADDHARALRFQNVRFVPVLVQASDDRRSLIFPADPELTPVPADAFSRSDWPSALGRYEVSQTLNYQEYTYDYQGLSPSSTSYGHRTFVTQRRGVQTGP